MNYTLYGDGIHDDTAAIQQMIDTSCELTLPAPTAHYLISKPLELHSNFKLILPRFAEIRLAAGSNCVMFKNKTIDDYANRCNSNLFGSYLNYYSPDAPCENISIEGGIWNFNNKEQNPNPICGGKFEPEGYSGFGAFFYNVRGLSISSLTLKNPCNFAITLDTVSYFNIENITFDFNDGNLYQCNMDGIHLCGNCHHGHIEKLFGTCYDDIVALNAQEGSCGPISNIVIRGIHTKGSYSAVRMLCASPKAAISNIHISDIYGTFYHFGISLQHYYDTGERGVFENITIDNVYASKSDRNLVKFYAVNNYRKYGVIDISGESDVKNLKITNLHRDEYIDAVPTILTFKEAKIENLILDNITSQNYTESESMPLISNDAEIKNLCASNLFEDGRKVFFE